MSGNTDFERVLRVQMNTVESTLIFLPALWLFAAFVSEPWAAAVGAAWLAARIWYAIAYQQSADQRGPPFIVSMLLFWGLVAGTAWKVIASFA
jgi:glutathione S-transferase